MFTYNCIQHTAVSYHNAIHDMNFLWKEKRLSLGITVLSTVKKFKMFPRWKQMFTYNWGWLNFDGLKCVFLSFSEKKKISPGLWVYKTLCVHVDTLSTVFPLTSHRLEITKPIGSLVFPKASEYLNKKLWELKHCNFFLFLLNIYDIEWWTRLLAYFYNMKKYERAIHSIYCYFSGRRSHIKHYVPYRKGWLPFYIFIQIGVLPLLISMLLFILKRLISYDSCYLMLGFYFWLDQILYLIAKLVWFHELETSTQT